MNKKIPTPLAILIIFLVIAVIIGISLWLCPKEETENVACTQEAKICPDGSAVGRTGPNCEFAECPVVTDETAGWQTYRNEEYGVEIKYPDGCLFEKTEEEEGGFSLDFQAKEEQNYENRSICMGIFSVIHNDNKLSVREYLEDQYGFNGLRFEETETSFGAIALEPLIAQNEEYYEKFGPGGSGLEYAYWVTGNENWIYSLWHYQDGGLLAKEMLSTFKILK